MSYLSMNNLYMKTHRFLPEARPRNLLLPDNKTTQIIENNNQIPPNGTDKTLQEVWSKYNFETNNAKAEMNAAFNDVKMSWSEKNAPEKVEEEIEDVKVEEVDVTSPINLERDEGASPSHHARRPMNAFLIFCKKHRPIVREKFPSLENRGVTRILGEWWALLDETDKAPYTGLAKEYKDAFLSANPNFKWYKLPAPPLRTLNVRPTNLQRVPSPVSSPTAVSAAESEFTPGKLADESQLGGLTSLMNNNYASSKVADAKLEEKPTENNNNIEEHGHQTYNSLLSPVNLIVPSLPPAPIKKRIFQKYLDNKNVARNLVMETELIVNEEHNHDSSNGSDNLTNQDLMNKVVEKLFTRQIDDEDDRNGLTKEVRKSGRQCKGKRYEQFMVEGRLLGNKRDTKLTSQKYCDGDKIESELSLKLESKPETETPNLKHTIERLAERTNMKSLLENQTETKPNERIRSISENSESSVAKSTNFNLDLRIRNLPSLSYEVFSQRKRESKKRKNRIKTDGGESRSKIAKLAKNETQPVGSKKRKNKQSITHLGKKDDAGISNDLLGLATLAEVAANTQKIDQDKISE